MMKSKRGTLNLRPSGAVLFVEIDAPPLNLIGPELISDFVDLIQLLDQGTPYKVVVFSSANPEFFIAHVDTTQIKEYRQAAAALTGEPSIALLFRRLSMTKAVSIAQIEGRARGAGSEFIMACDLRFGARETAIFAQMEGSMGAIPGGGGALYLSRLLGRGRALEVLLTADDYSAEVAELYGWINRAIPKDEIAEFVSKLAHRIAGFPMDGLMEIKRRMNQLTLNAEDQFREDSDAFLELLRHPDAQVAVKAAVDAGFGSSVEAELKLGAVLGKQ